MNGRYDVTGDQGAFESGSGNHVLRNQLGITNPREMNEVELHLLRQLYQALLVNDLADRNLRVADLKPGTGAGWAMFTAGLARSARSTWASPSCDQRSTFFTVWRCRVDAAWIKVYI